MTQSSVGTIEISSFSSSVYHDLVSVRSSSTNEAFKTAHSTGILPAKSSTSKEISTKRTDSISQPSHLKQLIREVENDPDLLAAEPDITTAISILNTAICRREQLSQGHRVQETCHSASGLSNDGDGSRPPTLPPVLDDRLEKAAFTHPAYDNDHTATYDRLEILGDAYIELMATKLIWDTFPDLPSGRISQIRELLVKNETLANFADLYGFSRRAVAPPSYASQPKRWVKTKGDVFEAYVAAIILSDPVNGYEIAERWLTGLWLPKLIDLGHQKTELRSKEQLAKQIMGKGIKLEYIEEQPSIQPKGSGSQTFFLGVYLTGWGWEKKHLGSGQGLSKSAAGDEAAKNALINTPLISQIILAKKSIIGSEKY